MTLFGYKLVKKSDIEFLYKERVDIWEKYSLTIREEGYISLTPLTLSIITGTLTIWSQGIMRISGSLTLTTVWIQTLNYTER